MPKAGTRRGSNPKGRMRNLDRGSISLDPNVDPLLKGFSGNIKVLLGLYWDNGE